MMQHSSQTKQRAKMQLQRTNKPVTRLTVKKVTKKDCKTCAGKVCLGRCRF
jgi:hypothetical protein